MPSALRFLIISLVLWRSQSTSAEEPHRPPLPKDTLPANLDIHQIPLGLDADRPVPEDNPLTQAKVELGRRLFFDPILSVDRTIACASCHEPDRGFASRDRVAVGVRGKRGTRNAPSLLNVAYVSPLLWDGRAGTLEEQALTPIVNPAEMGNTLEEVVRRLEADAAYQKQFDGAFSDGVTAANLARAIASFERVLLAGSAKPDVFKLQGRVGQMSERERHGMWLFESKGQCWRCHTGRNFTDNRFHNTGVAWLTADGASQSNGTTPIEKNAAPANQPRDVGRFAVTKIEADRGKFKTPSLRGVALTPPYMHNGCLNTLHDVVAFYNRGGEKNPQLDPAIKPLNLTAEEIDNLVAFLESLSKGAE